MSLGKRWVRRAIIHRYFPEIWYSIENWFSSRTGEEMLEIGCGRGIFTEAVAKDQWKVTAIDPSQLSVDRARKKTEKAGLQVKFEVGRPEALPFSDESFDALMCINFLEFAENPPMVLKEAHRVLRPGAKAVVVVFKPLTAWSLSWVAATLRKDSPERPFHQIDFDHFREMIVSSGLSIDSYRFRARYLPFLPMRKTVPWPVAGAMVALLKKPLPGEKQIRVPEKKIGLFHK